MHLSINLFFFLFHLTVFYHLWWIKRCSSSPRCFSRNVCDRPNCHPPVTYAFCVAVEGRQTWCRLMRPVNGLIAAVSAGRCPVGQEGTLLARLMSQSNAAGCPHQARRFSSVSPRSSTLLAVVRRGCCCCSCWWITRRCDCAMLTCAFSLVMKRKRLKVDPVLLEFNLHFRR